MIFLMNKDDEIRSSLEVMNAYIKDRPLIDFDLIKFFIRTDLRKKRITTKEKYA